MLLQFFFEKRKRRRFQIGPATPGEVSGTKKRDNFLEKNPVKTVENYSFHWYSLGISLSLSRKVVPDVRVDKKALARTCCPCLSLVASSADFPGLCVLGLPATPAADGFIRPWL